MTIANAKRHDPRFNGYGAHAAAAVDGLAAGLPRFTRSMSQAVNLAIVVDDDPVMCGAVSDALRDAGFAVIEAGSAEAALQRIEKLTLSPTVIVSDVDLGDGMSGVQFAATVHARWPETGVLLVSGNPLPAAAQHEHFLPKPMSARRLLDEIVAVATC